MQGRVVNMLEICNAEVFNIDGAMRGMRNPMGSNNKASPETDLKLAKALIKAGPDHRKFMRQILVSCDITAPLYWWKEMDQYKVGTVTDSESTMHTLMNKPFNIKMFSADGEEQSYWIFMLDYLEELRRMYLDTKEESTWRHIIQILPCAFNQTRTWTANYEVLYNIYHARNKHKLSEWHSFCKWIETLPKGELIHGRSDMGNT